MEIWINPACSKCRTAVSTLDEAGAEYTQRRYLDQPPTVAELDELLGRLGLEPWDVARTGDAAAKEVGLRALPKDAENRPAWIATLVENPRLILRPIITLDDGSAVIARDPETLARVIEQAGS
ncbi:ArsC/Spx/MgsR family protein [Nocardioides sp. Bht2]|uniref:ArsC/Spx/MgsR family protein n=1 Tax=Nocardioides sp. Bht2 TaxID=3392297 RepID=UPI0039B5AD38